ncbi:hypothetical protein ABID22_002221 [Pontibacter aydingkolensis]
MKKNIIRSAASGVGLGMLQLPEVASGFDGHRG